MRWGCIRHQDDAGTRSRGRLRYVGAAPFPVLRAGAKARVDRVDDRIMAAAVQVLVVSDEMVV